MNALHFCPQDGWFGDPMPLYHDGIYHIYYTKLYKTGKMSWGHLSTTDFVQYTQHPDPFVPGEPGVPYNTGCVFWADGLFHAYYAGYDAQGTLAMLHAQSCDGITFSAPGEVCFSRPADLYRDDDTWRDPAVVYDEAAGIYRMVFCAKAPQQAAPNPFAGVIGQAVSKDLKTWQVLPPMSLSGIATTAECPQIFPVEDRWALIYYWHETRLRTADGPTGPWLRGDVISPDHFDFMAARHMTDGKRHFILGWLPRRDCDCMERIWGGNMLLPRELSFKGGTTPATRFVREVYDLFCHPFPGITAQSAVHCTPGWSVQGSALKAQSREGGALVCWKELPDTCLMTLKVTLDDPNALLQLLLGAHPAYGGAQQYLDEGYTLMLDASEGLIRLRRHYMWDQRNDIAVIPFKFEPGQPITLEVLRNGSILEVGINGEQTLVSRMLQDEPGALAISLQDGGALVEDLSVFTLD